MLIWTGTAAVENGSTTVIVDTGSALTTEVVANGAMVVVDGVVYFADSLTDTTTLELTREYTGSTDTVPMEIWPVSQDTTNLVNLAQIVARTQAQLNILDKNSQGLFFKMKGVTGAGDPGPGFIAFDDADPTLVTEAYVDVLDANGRAVSELVGLWEAGTTIVARSLTTTAYRAFTVATNTPEGGWINLALTYVGHDGVLADNEALGISWSSAASGLEISATGLFENREDYDEAPAGFVFLSADGDGDTITVACLFRKNSATTADWGPAVPFQGPKGDRGWSPVYAVVSDSARRVMRLVDYVGGEGAKPTTGINQYLSAGGLVASAGDATNLRGEQGLSAYQVAVVAGYSGTAEQWLASLVGASAYQIAVANGFSGDEETWLLALRGVDGADPGILLNWDTGTSDADPGAGNIRANSLTLPSATQLFISKTGRGGNSIEAWLATLGSSTNATKGDLVITDPATAAQVAFTMTAYTNASNYVKLTVENGAGASGFADELGVSFQFSRAGNQGATDLASLASSVNGAANKAAPAPTDRMFITDSEASFAGRRALLSALRPAIGTLAHGKLVFTDSGDVTAAMVGKVLVADRETAISFNFDDAATLGADWAVIVKNIGAGDLTLAPDGSETIDGETSLVLRQGQSALVTCDGVGLSTAFFGGGVTTGKAIAMAIVFG